MTVKGTMKVQDVMASEVKPCRPETNQPEAAAPMLEYDGLAETLAPQTGRPAAQA
jgi:hypothetical protein